MSRSRHLATARTCIHCRWVNRHSLMKMSVKGMLAYQGARCIVKLGDWLENLPTAHLAMPDMPPWQGLLCAVAAVVLTVGTSHKEWDHEIQQQLAHQH